jgi:nicotinate-nucleotide adenylyltransferase
MARVGIVGGTFDPIHLGHLIIAEEARVQLGLERVIFIPAGRPWLKGSEPSASPKDRLEMTRLAVRSHPSFRCASIEVERGGNTYTVETLEVLSRSLPGAELFYVVGLDSLREFHRWRSPARILELATLVVLLRPGYRRPPLNALRGVAPAAEERVRILKGPLMEVSSTDIRRRVAEGRSIRYLVPPEVEEYIARRGLYRAKEESK